MPTEVFRICWNGALSLPDLPYGSTLADGRWHRHGAPPFGHRVVYAGGTRAITQLEKRVHCNGVQPADQALVRLRLPARAQLDDAVDLGLRTDWASDMGYSQRFGLDWLKRRGALGLWVPSFIEPRERNVVLNPEHPDWQGVEVHVEDPDFHFDARLF